MAGTADFRQWCAQIRRSRLGKNALKELDNRFPLNASVDLPQPALVLRDSVLVACYCAAMFKAVSDPGQLKRWQDREVSKAVRNQIKAIATLRSFARTYRTATGMAFGQALKDQKQKGIVVGTTDGTARDVVDILDGFLESYSFRLGAPIPFVQTGNVLSRFEFGCLIYDSPLDDGKHNRLPDVATMLLFDLVQIFRLHSIGSYRRQIGEPMPKVGKPHYAIAVAFVNATQKIVPLDSVRASTRLKSFLAKNPDVGYFPWPDMHQTF